VNALIAAVLVALALCAAPMCAAQPAGNRVASAPAAQPIPFRKDESLADMALTVGTGLVVAIGAAAVALYLLRRYATAMDRRPGRRLRVIETVRLGPKSALFLIELDGRALLIGQHGETLATLAHPSNDHAP